MRSIVFALLLAASAAPPTTASAAPSPAIAAAVADPHRTPAFRLRDRYRHPIETLSFFGVRPDQTIVEYQPTGGWYTEILAPMVSARGRFIGLAGPSQKSQDGLKALIDGGGERYRGATAATLDVKTGTSTVADGSADVVLTFRNIHNLTIAGNSAAPYAFSAFYRMLKPGGVLGVEEHRLPETADSAREATSGYLKRSTVVALATAAGFRLAGESEVNANPKDTHDWPEGVWTLPPTLRRGEADRATYLAIGESDRMTLRFIKPRR